MSCVPSCSKAVRKLVVNSVQQVSNAFGNDSRKNAGGLVALTDVLSALVLFVAVSVEPMLGELVALTDLFCCCSALVTRLHCWTRPGSAAKDSTDDLALHHTFAVLVDVDVIDWCAYPELARRCGSRLLFVVIVRQRRCFVMLFACTSLDRSRATAEPLGREIVVTVIQKTAIQLDLDRLH